MLAIFRGQLFFEFGNKVPESRSQDGAQVAQLNYIESPYAALDVAYERLWPPHRGRALSLRKTGSETISSQQSKKYDVFITIDRLWHLAARFEAA